MITFRRMLTYGFYASIFIVLSCLRFSGSFNSFYFDTYEFLRAEALYYKKYTHKYSLLNYIFSFMRKTVKEKTIDSGVEHLSLGIIHYICILLTQNGFIFLNLFCDTIISIILNKPEYFVFSSFFPADKASIDNLLIVLYTKNYEIAKYILVLLDIHYFPLLKNVINFFSEEISISSESNVMEQPLKYLEEQKPLDNLEEELTHSNTNENRKEIFLDHSKLNLSVMKKPSQIYTFLKKVCLNILVILVLYESIYTHYIFQERSHRYSFNVTYFFNLYALSEHTHLIFCILEISFVYLCSVVSPKFLYIPILFFKHSTPKHILLFLTIETKLKKVSQALLFIQHYLYSTLEYNLTVNLNPINWISMVFLIIFTMDHLGLFNRI